MNLVLFRRVMLVSFIIVNYLEDINENFFDENKVIIEITTYLVIINLKIVFSKIVAGRLPLWSHGRIQD